MKITKLTIVNCNRIKSKSKLVLNIDTDITVITGESGIGKSTLLEYMLPYPINKSDFYQGGYRKCEFLYDNNDYIVISNYKGHHKLIENGVEITKGTTRKEFIHIIDEKFNFNNEIYKIILSRKKFCNITSNDRKDWLSMISVVDLTFAYRLYNSMNKSVRELKGGVKLLESKMVEVSDALAIDKELHQIHKEISTVEKIRNRLLSKQYVTTNKDTDEIASMMNKGRDILKRINYEVLSLDQEYINNKLERVNRNISIILDRMKSLENSVVVNIDELLYKTDDLSKRIDRIEKENKLNINIEYLNDLKSYLDDNTWVELVRDLDSGVIPNHEEFIIRYETNNLKLTNYKSKLSEIDGNIGIMKEYKNRDVVECPKCHTGFKPNYNPKKEKELLELRADYINKIEELSKIIDSDKQGYTSISERNNALNRLKHFMNGNIYLATKTPLFQSFEDVNLSERFNTLITNILTYLNISKGLLDMKNELSILNNKVKVVEGINRDTITKNRSELDRLNRHYSTMLQIKSSYTQTLKDINNEVNKVTSLDGVRHYLQNLIDDREIYRQADIDKELKAIVKLILERIDIDLKSLYNKLTSINDKKSRASIYKKSIEDGYNEIHRLEEILKALDPKTGLIGESVQSFLGYIVDEVNQILSEIFTYNIYIDFDRDNLDYKFKLIVRDTEPTSDISLASSGQQEVINLAFLIVTYYMMDLKFPLLLDETGNRLDKYHRDELFKYTTKLKDNLSNRIMMVSHYANNQIESEKIKVVDIV